MECKGDLLILLGLVYRVLIETLWNVKVEIAQHASKLCLVLIETLWNVKDARRMFPRQCIPY